MQKCIGRGVVTGISEHHNGKGKHLMVHVAHGRKSPTKKDKNGAVYAGGYDDRPQSTLIVPKSHANRYRVGQRLAIATDADQDMDEDGAGDAQDLDSSPDAESQDAARGLFNATRARRS
jgi:hypothetical protein